MTSTTSTDTPSDTPTTGSSQELPETVDLADISMSELAKAFAVALETANREALAKVLSEQVVYQAPGRSIIAGIHHGRCNVVAMLTIAAVPGTEVSGVEVTESMSEGTRAFLVFQISGTVPHGTFEFEVAFHLQSDCGLITGITEYSGDQYTADELVGGSTRLSPSQPAVQSRSRIRRLLRRRG